MTAPLSHRHGPVPPRRPRGRRRRRLAAGRCRQAVDDRETRAREPPGARRRRHAAGRGTRAVRPVRLAVAGADRHRLQPRPEPLRLGAGDARALPRDAERRLAHDDLNRRPAARRRRRPHLAERSPARPCRSPAAPTATRPWPGSSRRSRTSTASPASGSKSELGAELGRVPRAGPPGTADCRVRTFISQFDIVVAFDDAVAAPDPAPRPLRSARPRRRPRDRRRGARSSSRPTDSAAEQTGEGEEGRQPVPGVEREASDRAIVAGVLVVGLLAAFWFVILTPKRARSASSTPRSPTPRPASPSSSRSSTPARREGRLRDRVPAPGRARQGRARRRRRRQPVRQFNDIAGSRRSTSVGLEPSEGRRRPARDAGRSAGAGQAERPPARQSPDDVEIRRGDDAGRAADRGRRLAASRSGRRWAAPVSR